MYSASSSASEPGVQSPISMGQQAENQDSRGDPGGETLSATGLAPDQPSKRAKSIDMDDESMRLQPERAENPINAAMSTPPQEASLASAVSHHSSYAEHSIPDCVMMYWLTLSCSIMSCCLQPCIYNASAMEFHLCQ